MNSKPPIGPGPGTNTRNNNYTPMDNKARMSGPIPRQADMPGTPIGPPRPSGNLTQNMRSSSRGSFLDDINDAGDIYVPRGSKDNPVNLKSIKTTINPSDPLISTAQRPPMSSYRPMDPNNPLNYHPEDNLRKLRNKVYATHNYGPEAEDPFTGLNLQDMNDDDERELDRIRQMEDEVNRKKEEIQKTKMKLEK